MPADFDDFDDLAATDAAEEAAEERQTWADSFDFSDERTIGAIAAEQWEAAFAFAVESGQLAPEDSYMLAHLDMYRGEPGDPDYDALRAWEDIDEGWIAEVDTDSPDGDT
jgi:hypothetical protein